MGSCSPKQIEDLPASPLKHVPDVLFDVTTLGTDGKIVGDLQRTNLG
jgi:hypothetical protein